MDATLILETTGMHSPEDIASVRRIARQFAARCPSLDADDLAQEGLLRLDAIRSNFDEARGSWRKFANGCIRNLFRDTIRREMYRTRRLLPLDDVRHGNIACPRTRHPERLIAMRETRRHVSRLIGRLRNSEVDVVHLMLQGCEDETIARLTGRSSDSIQTARCRAIPRLQRLLIGCRAA